MMGDGILIELDRGFSRFRYCNLVKLGRSIIRARKLRQTLTFDGVSYVTPPEAAPLVTLTTIPSRLHKITPVILSLLDQELPPRRIILAIPSHSRRENVGYDEAFLKSLPAIVEVLACEDHGPATKLLPTLSRYGDETLVVVDDDVIYPRNFLSNLWRHHQATSEAVIGYRGVLLQAGTPFRKLRHRFATAVRTPTLVDIVFGTWGYLVPANTFDEQIFDYNNFPDEVRWVDDIWISGHLARLHVPRLIAPADCFPLELDTSSRASLTDGINRDGKNDQIAIEAFTPYWGANREKQDQVP